MSWTSASRSASAIEREAISSRAIRLEPPELLHHLDRRRTQHDDEQCGHDTEDEREEDLDRHLLRLLLGPLTCASPASPATARAARWRPGCRSPRPAPSRRRRSRSSSRSVRSLSARSASIRPVPICISWSTRKNSWPSGPSVLRATCASAASKARPASTEIVSRSMASGSSRAAARCGRSRPGRSHIVGPNQPSAARHSVMISVQRSPAPNSGGSTAPRNRPRSRPSALRPRIRSTSQPGRVAGQVEAAADAARAGRPGVAAAAGGDEALRQRAEDALGERLLELVVAQHAGDARNVGEGLQRAVDRLALPAADRHRARRRARTAKKTQPRPAMSRRSIGVTPAPSRPATSRSRR